MRNKTPSIYLFFKFKANCSDWQDHLFIFLKSQFLKNFSKENEQTRQFAMGKNFELHKI